MLTVGAGNRTLPAGIGYLIVLAIVLPGDDVRDDNVDEVPDRTRTRTRERLALLAAKQKLLQARHAQLETDMRQQYFNVSQQIHGLQQQIDNKTCATTPQRPPQVNFLAHLVHDVDTTEEQGDRKLVFGNVIHNVGRAYNATAGYFTAPHNGSYFFTLTTTSGDGRSWAAAAIRTHRGHPGRWVCVTDTKDPLNGLVQSCQGVVHLDKGQQVWTTSRTPDYSYAAALCAFSGFLIDVDGI